MYSPGSISATCMLILSNSFNSALNDSAIASIANFDAQYGAKKGIEILPASEDTNIIFPFFFLQIFLLQFEL